MNRLTILSLKLLLITVFSCTNEIPSQEDKEKAARQMNEKIISELNDKYSIRYLFDTLRYDYTIQFEDLLNTNYQMIRNFNIQD